MKLPQYGGGIPEAQNRKGTESGLEGGQHPSRPLSWKDGTVVLNPFNCRHLTLLAFQGGRWCLCSRDPWPVLQVLLCKEVQDVRDQDCRDRRDCPRAGFCAIIISLWKEGWSRIAPADHAKNGDRRKKKKQWSNVKLWMNELVFNPFKAVWHPGQIIATIMIIPCIVVMMATKMLSGQVVILLPSIL